MLSNYENCVRGPNEQKVNFSKLLIKVLLYMLLLTSDPLSVAKSIAYVASQAGQDRAQSLTDLNQPSSFR